MRPIGKSIYRGPAPVIWLALIVVCLVLCSGAAAANVGLSLRVNLWEVVPLDDPVFEDLRRLADLGVISYPEVIHEDRLTRYDVADLIYRASRNLESKQGSGLSLNDSDGQKILAGLRKEYEDEIQWVSWGYDNLRISNSDIIPDPVVPRSTLEVTAREGISARLDEHRERIAASVPSLSPASTAGDLSNEMLYAPDPLTLVIIPGAPGLTLNIAGMLSSIEAQEPVPGVVSPYSLYPESIRNLKYRIDAEARSPGFQLRFSYEGLSSMPRHSISADSTQSEASAVYEISPDVRLIAGMVLKSTNKGITSESGVDLRFQVVPTYLSASLGLNVVDPEADQDGSTDEWRRLSTEIGLSGQYPLSEVVQIRGTYLYRVYADRLGQSQTTLSTGVDYTPLPGAKVTAGVEVIDDPEEGVSSVKGVGLGYEIGTDTSVKLSVFHSEGGQGSIDPGVGSKWGAEFQWTFKF